MAKNYTSLFPNRLLCAVVWIPATRGIGDRGSHHTATLQHLHRVAQELSPDQSEMLQLWRHQPHRCISGFVEAQCWEKCGMLWASLANRRRSSVVVAGPAEDGGRGVIGPRAHCHHDLWPSYPAATVPTASVSFSQPGRRTRVALEWVQEQGETNNPRMAGCKSHESTRLQRLPGDLVSFVCWNVPFPPRDTELGTCQPTAALPLAWDNLHQHWPWCDW